MPLTYFRLSLLFITLLTGVSLSSCQENKKITLASGITNSQSAQSAEILSEVMKIEGWEIEATSGVEYFLSKNLENVNRGKVDFAYIANDEVVSKDNAQIRSVLPVFPLVAIIFYKADEEIHDLPSLLKDHKIIGLETDFFQDLFESNIEDPASLDYNRIVVKDLSGFEKILAQDSVEVICAFGSIYSPIVENLIRNGWRFFSLGDIDWYGKGSSVEGFCLRNPQYYPFIIPRNTYGTYPDSPILTIALDVVLITQASTSQELVFGLVEDIFNYKQFLAQEGVMFSTLTEQFDPGRLTFPLHQGTDDYLNRNEPSIFERYAELFGVIFSIFMVVIGLFARTRRNRKDRIDQYYVAALEADNLEDLSRLEREAVHLVEHEKVEANTSFAIFLQLIDMRRRDLEKNGNQNS